MSHRRTQRGEFTLTLLPGGGAELTRQGVQVWASDSDDEFADAFGQEFLDEDDAEELFEYLVESNCLTDQQADDARLVIESYERPPGEEDDDEDDDEDLDGDDDDEDDGDDEEDITPMRRRATSQARRP